MPLGVFAINNCEYPDDDEWFSFCIEQDGKLVPIKNNTIEIEKAPFTLILLFRNPLGILVNFSKDDNLYKGFLKNKPLAGILEQPDLFMGIGEYDGNPDEMVLIDSIAPHFIFYTDGASHRFSRTELSRGYIVGRRLISNYTTYANEFRPIPITELHTDILFISFMYSRWDENYNRLELQKEAVKIIFQ